MTGDYLDLTPRQLASPAVKWEGQAFQRYSSACAALAGLPGTPSACVRKRAGPTGGGHFVEGRT
eukprot:708031-Pleurochrysis_carterae.AAC.2